MLGQPALGCPPGEAQQQWLISVCHVAIFDLSAIIYPELCCYVPA
jgi:hypothetical protein